jgi:Na+/H+-dicarboxylate symporter
MVAFMKTITLNSQIFIAAFLGLLLGATLQFLPDDSSLRENTIYFSALIGNLFIGLLKMILIPLVFLSIVVGVASLQAHHQIHKVWISTLVFFISSMALAITLALVVMNIFNPGEGLHLDMFKDAMEKFESKQLSAAEFGTQFLQSLFQNPFSALAKGDVLAVVIFALFLGIALVIGRERYKNTLTLLNEWLDIIMCIVNWIMRIAPLGVFALLLKLAATQQSELLQTMLQFILIIIAMLLVHGVIVLPLLLYLFTKKTPWWFWRGAREALITAFATSSSSATLPVTLGCVTENLKVRKEIGSFVVPLGATLNMDGTALYEAAAALFIANLAGIDLSFSQQLIVFVMSMIAAMGAPGIPSAGMVTMIMVLQSVGLPAEAIAILLPIDRLLDTFRTAVNVEGDMIGSVIVDKIAIR